MGGIKLWSLLLMMCFIIRPSTQCLSRYTTWPIDGFSCQTSVYKNISDIYFDQCRNICIGSKDCWTLSYNHPGRYCLLAEEPCVAADVINGFSLMIMRPKEPQRCVEWVPFNKTYGRQYGFPKRAFEVVIEWGSKSVVARATEADITLTGRSTNRDYIANLLNSTEAIFNLDHGYEILVVRDTCSVAWVRHRTHDPVPVGAIVAGKDSLNRNHYVVGRSSPLIMIGRLIEGEPVAHFTHGTAFHSFGNMFMLVSLAWS